MPETTTSTPTKPTHFVRTLELITRPSDGRQWLSFTEDCNKWDSKNETLRLLGPGELLDVLAFRKFVTVQDGAYELKGNRNTYRWCLEVDAFLTKEAERIGAEAIKSRLQAALARKHQ